MRQSKTKASFKLLLLLALGLLLSQPALSQIAPIDLSKSNCGEDSYFSTAIYQCKKCGENAERYDSKSAKHLPFQSFRRS